MTIPDSTAGLLVSLTGWMPCAPVTPDQWKMLQSDNVVSIGAKGLPALGVDPTPLADVAPAWLVQHRRQGRFSKASALHSHSRVRLQRNRLVSHGAVCPTASGAVTRL